MQHQQQCQQHFDIAGVRVELQRSCGSSGDQDQELSVWTDAVGVVLLEWQVQEALDASWQVPPPAWPAQSGVNGQALQTMLVSCSGGRGGQQAMLKLRPWHAIRWRLFCVGPPLRWVPDEMEELLIRAAGEHGIVAPTRGLGSSHKVRDADSEESGSDDDVGCGVALYLRIVGNGGSLAGAPREGFRVVLATRSLAALGDAAMLVFPSEGPFHFLEDSCHFRAVGVASGLSVRIESDAAFGIFLSSAADSQLGAPTVELRPRSDDQACSRQRSQ